MSEQDLTKCISRYFKEPNIDINNLGKLIQYVQEYGRKNLQQKIIQKIFFIAENIMTKDNLKIIIKRYIHIINDILERDQKLPIQYRYQQAVSNEIVHQFISMLRNIFKYGPMELFLDLKFYRKKWAKRITDHAYVTLQGEAQRQMKLDLDKGFPEETVKKLQQSFEKRQFSQTDIEKYLPTMNSQTSAETRKSSADSSSEQEEQKPRKRVKKYSEERRSSERSTERQYYDMVNPPHSFNLSNSTFVNGYAIDPRRSNQNLYVHMPNMPNIYPPNSYFPPPRVNQSAVGYYPQVQVQAQTQNYYRAPNSYNPYGYPPNVNQPSYQNYPSGNYDPYMDSRYQNMSQNKQMAPIYMKAIEKIQGMKRGWFFECKFCGLLMSTNQKYDQHMFQHFSQSQKHYEVSHSRAQHTKKGSKSLMPTVQEWIQSNRIKTGEQKFIVPIEGGQSRNQICLICRGEIKVIWSQQIDSWVFEDAVRTNCPELGKSICHAECYQTVDDFDKSSRDSK